MPRVTVHVTADDILAGFRCDCDGCPVAIGIARLCGPDVTVLVDHCNVELTAHRMSESLILPEAAGQFVADFDGERPVKPFSFPLDIPDAFLRQPTQEIAADVSHV